MGEGGRGVFSGEVYVFTFLYFLYFSTLMVRLDKTRQTESRPVCMDMDWKETHCGRRRVVGVHGVDLSVLSV
jgi:hypothetical protein